MAFQPVSGHAVDIKKEPNAPRVGTYVGKEDIVTKIGPQVVWKFVDDADQQFGIYGFTNLNNAMAGVKEGDLCRITYKGTAFVKTKFKPTGQDVHQCLVEVDDQAEITDATDPLNPEVPF